MTDGRTDKWMEAFTISPSLKRGDKKRFWDTTYPKYLDALTPYHTCPKL